MKHFALALMAMGMWFIQPTANAQSLRILSMENGHLLAQGVADNDDSFVSVSSSTMEKR